MKPLYIGILILALTACGSSQQASTSAPTTTETFALGGSPEKNPEPVQPYVQCVSSDLINTWGGTKIDQDCSVANSSTGLIGTMLLDDGNSYTINVEISGTSGMKVGTYQCAYTIDKSYATEMGIAAETAINSNPMYGSLSQNQREVYAEQAYNQAYQMYSGVFKIKYNCGDGIETALSVNSH